MNELIFLAETFLIIAFALGALKLGEQALVTWISIQAVIANLFVVKQIDLFGLEVTASDGFAIGSLLGLNFLQEFFGQDKAKQATWVCFFVMVFFALVAQLHLLYAPSSNDTAHAAFVTILTPSFRLLVASMGVFFIVQQIDIRFFSFLKNRFPGASLPLRLTFSLIVAQMLDTILFSFIGLYGIVASMFDIIVMSLIIKFLVIFCLTSSVKWAKI